MTRKRIRHAPITNDSNRNATFGRRVEGFLKKANEFSTLCGADVGIIVHKQGREGGEGAENNAVMWPSPDIFGERLQKLMDFPFADRTRKMVSHDKFLEELIDKEANALVKFKERTQLKESEQLSEQLLNQVGRDKNIDELDLHGLNCLKSFSEKMLQRLEKREVELTNGPQQPSSGIDPNAAINIEAMELEVASPTTQLLENLSNDQWFMDFMADELYMNNYLGGPSNGGGDGV